jgi:hypothetical protein
MLVDDDTARACLLGLTPIDACIAAKDTTPDARGSSPLASLAAGVYLPGEKALLVRDDEGGAADGTVLLHEVVHALQDAHFGLAPLLRDDGRGADALAARHAFVEGDASFAVLRDANLLEPLDDAFVEAFCKGFQISNRKGAGAALPPTVADALVAPYIHGTRFVWSLYAHGRWAAVNAAWRRPPESTEQLLHVAKYRRRERPVPLPGPPRLPGTFEARGAATFGELDLRTWLGLFLTADEASRLAADWGNGAATLYARGSERALALRVRWDNQARGRAKEVASRLDAVRGGTCTERPGLGPLAIEAEGRDLVAIAGPAEARCDTVAGWRR